MGLDANLKRAILAVDGGLRRAAYALGLGVEGEDYRAFIRVTRPWGELGINVALAARAFAEGDYYEHYRRVREALKRELRALPWLIESINLALFPLGEGPDGDGGDPDFSSIEDLLGSGLPGGGLTSGSADLPTGTS